MRSSKRSILIVDSDQEHAMRLACELGKLDFDVRIVDGERDALDAAIGGGVDLVLTDHAHPEIDGIGLTRSIKRARSDVRVVFYSDALDLEMYIEEMNSGAEDCLHKPCRTEEVLRVVEKSLLRLV